MAKLTEQQRRFCMEYTLDFCGKAAAIRAGYAKRSAERLAYNLLSKPHIKKEIERLRAKHEKQVVVSKQRVLEELAAIAFADVGDVLDVDDRGKVLVKELKKLAPEVRRTIGSIEQTSIETKMKSGSIEKVRLGIKQHSKVKALELLMSHLGMNAPQKLEHSGPDGKPIQNETRVLTREAANTIAKKVLFGERPSNKKESE